MFSMREKNLDKMTVTPSMQMMILWGHKYHFTGWDFFFFNSKVQFTHNHNKSIYFLKYPQIKLVPFFTNNFPPSTKEFIYH